jgi:hypothetical protein
MGFLVFSYMKCLVLKRQARDLEEISKNLKHELTGIAVVI